MKKIYQTRYGTEGNCWAACIATVFGVELSEVDQCACNHADWAAQTTQWLRSRGFDYIEVNRRADGTWPMTKPADGTVCLLGVKTSRGTAHVIVAEIYGSKIGEQEAIGFYLIHDPLPNGSIEHYTSVDAAIFFVASPPRLPLMLEIPVNNLPTQ
jgi:hypothetical protein